MKRILIPTDFNDKTLELIRFTANVFADEVISITLLHVLRMPEGIGELLMLPRRNKHRQMESSEFRKSYLDLQAVYPQTIKRIRLDFLYGETQALFRNYLSAQAIDAIVYPDNYSFQKASKESIDPRVLIQKSGCPVLTNVWQQDIKVLQAVEV